MSGPGFSTAMLSRDSYPIVMTWFRCADRNGLNPVHEITVEAPETLVLVRIPPLFDKYGPTWLRAAYGDGEVHEVRDDCPGET